MANEKSVSIIVPVYNACSTIELCMESLRALHWSAYEIFFVDDGSKDSTVQLIQRLKGEDARVRLIAGEHKGPAAARNAGIKAANGEYVFFTDSDVVVSADWISGLMKCFTDEVGAVGGGVEAFSLATLCEQAEQLRYRNLYGDSPRFIEALPTCNLAVRRDVLRVINGFDERYCFASGEDHDLCRRIRRAGWKIWFEPSIKIRHMHPRRLKNVLRRGYLHGGEAVRERVRSGESLLPVMDDNPLRTGPSYFLRVWKRFSGMAFRLRLIMCFYEYSYMAGVSWAFLRQRLAAPSRTTEKIC
jgi:GT2 family glycosyltransferase